MKKKFLACTLAALMCLQPASAVLAEDLDFGEDSTGTGSRYHGQRNCPDRWRCHASWHGYADRAENRSKYADCAGCHAGCSCRNREICGDHVKSINLHQIRRCDSSAF